MKLKAPYLWVVFSLTACGGRAPLPDLVSMGGTTPGATAYAPSASPTPHPIGDVVIAALDDFGIEATLDPPLSYAAHLLAPVMDSNQTASREAVVFALSHAGIHYPVEHISGAELSGASLAQAGQVLAEYLRDDYHKTQFSRLGVGVTEVAGALRIMLLLGRPQTAIDRLDRRQPAGAIFALNGRLEPGYGAPRAVVTAPSGDVSQVETQGVGADYQAHVQCPQRPGRIQVEVLADGPVGPSVVANFPVWCGVPPQRSASVPMGLSRRVGQTPQESEQLLFALLNDARTKAGLAPLAWHAHAAEVSRAHSRDMAQNGFAGHVSPQTGGPKDRADRAGLEAAVLQENIGMAGNEEWVHEGLMASPGHRKNILSTAVQSVGIGVVHGHKELYATQLFVGQRDISPAAAARGAMSLSRAIEALDRREGTPAFVPDPALARIAQSVAEGLASGEVEGGKASKTAFARLDGARLGYTTASVQAGVADDPSALAGAEEAKDATLQTYGVGVAGGRYEGRDTFLVVVIYAGR